MENVRAKVDYFKHDPFVKGAVYKYGEYVGRINGLSFEFKNGVIGAGEIELIKNLISCFNHSDELMPESEVEWIVEAKNEGMTWQQLADKYCMTVRCLKRKIGFK